MAHNQEKKQTTETDLKMIRIMKSAKKKKIFEAGVVNV